ncbi:hypothetical protein EON78_04400, partial [bacterium]
MFFGFGASNSRLSTSNLGSRLRLSIIDNNISSITRDQQGFIWISTS